MPRTTRLYSVDSIQLALTKSIPPELLVTAIGKAATTGWNDIALVPLEKQLSADGILDLDFVGTPPQEVFAAYLVPAIAHYVWKDADKVIGVKVHARSNDLTQLLHNQPYAGATPFVGEDAPRTTQMVGEGHGPQAAAAEFANLTTLAIGEEQHPTTLAVGEEHPPTSLYVGEEGHGPTFIAGEGGHPPTSFWVGEEGTHFFGETPTFFPGEHGPSNVIAEQPSHPIVEHPSDLVAEHGSSPLGEQSVPDPWGWVERAGINAFGRR